MSDPLLPNRPTDSRPPAPPLNEATQIITARPQAKVQRDETQIIMPQKQRPPAPAQSRPAPPPPLQRMPRPPPGTPPPILRVECRTPPPARPGATQFAGVGGTCP
nr:hypothetical protein [Picosynechococcus sp. NKBG15041c]